MSFLYSLFLTSMTGSYAVYCVTLELRLDAEQQPLNKEQWLRSKKKKKRALAILNLESKQENTHIYLLFICF